MGATGSCAVVHRLRSFLHLSISCFNAFSRVDVRVDVKIPGSVLAYVIDLRGERHETTNEIWQETYMSAILRAILYGDDPTFWLEAYRRLDPITSREGEIRFLEAADALFSQGIEPAATLRLHCFDVDPLTCIDFVKAGRLGLTPRSKLRALSRIT